MKTRAVVYLFLVIASASAGERWWSPDKFFSIVPPDGWKYSESTPSDAPPSYVFSSPDGGSEVRISATYDLSLPKVLPDEVLELAFPDERGVAPIQRTHGSGWDGLRREYINTAQTKHWLGIAARRDSTAVLLTMVAHEKDFERVRDTFEKVAESLQLGH